MVDARKIGQAVNDCLERCCTAKMPLFALAEFVAALEDDPAWRRREIELVELRAQRVLSRLVSQRADDEALSDA